MLFEYLYVGKDIYVYIQKQKDNNTIKEVF